MKIKKTVRIENSLQIFRKCWCIFEACSFIKCALVFIQGVKTCYLIIQANTQNTIYDWKSYLLNKVIKWQQQMNICMGISND